jgi:hypothetical protein
VQRRAPPAHSHRPLCNARAHSQPSERCTARKAAKAFPSFRPNVPAGQAPIARRLPPPTEFSAPPHRNLHGKRVKDDGQLPRVLPASTCIAGSRRHDPALPRQARQLSQLAAPRSRSQKNAPRQHERRRPAASTARRHRLRTCRARPVWRALTDVTSRTRFRGGLQEHFARVLRRAHPLPRWVERAYELTPVLRRAPRSGRGSLGNDPSAGSPTETLLRLLLPLSDPVWPSSRGTRPSTAGKPTASARS